MILELGEAISRGKGAGENLWLTRLGATIVIYTYPFLYISHTLPNIIQIDANRIDSVSNLSNPSDLFLFLLHINL